MYNISIGRFIMKKNILAILFVVAFFGCSSTESEGSNSIRVDTVSIAVWQINFDYFEIYDADGYFYKMHNTSTIRNTDTVYFDVPDCDSINLMIHNSNGDILQTSIISIPVVDDSLYWIRY